MSKPDWCSQEVWEASERPAKRVHIDVVAGQIWDIRPTIAHAILAAEKRGEEREREVCAELCGGLRHIDRSAESEDWVDGTFACQSAIRARSTP